MAHGVVAHTKELIAAAMLRNGFQVASKAVSNGELYLHDVHKCVDTWAAYEKDNNRFWDSIGNCWYKAAKKLSPRTWE
jgi:hypothetical protein